jgi:Flp pilus assembly protein TadD
VGQCAEAAACDEQALRLRPAYAEAHNNLGVALAEQGQLTAALPYYEQAIRLNSGVCEAHFDLGNALGELGRFDEAVASYHRALHLRPDWPEAAINLGLAYAAQGRYDQAVGSLEQALRLRATDAAAHCNLGLVLEAAGRLAEAVAHYDQAAQFRPDSARAHFLGAQLRLLLGDLERGWAGYEWRWKLPEMVPRPLPQPLWDGSPLAGRAILLWTEQGLGDTLQFIRYASPVKRRGGRVIVECSESLWPLLSRCPGIDCLTAPGAPAPDCDVQAPLLSLPGIFGTSLATIPAEIPYLFAEDTRVEHWRRHLGPADGLRIGITWQGNPDYPADVHRSFPLAHFACVARIPGVRLLSLQQGPGHEQLGRATHDFAVTDLGSQFRESTGSFLDTAAAMRNLDLVIAPNTALAHLAGALGVPVWVALSTSADWRWLLDRDDSPWYPTMRLFRQDDLGNWGLVFGRIAAALQERLAATDRMKPVPGPAFPEA